MKQIIVTDCSERINGLYYIRNAVSEPALKAGAEARIAGQGKRCRLTVDCPEYYADIIQAEISDKIAEVIVVGYKYEFLKREIKVAGLSETEREILLASLIAADLKDDKKFAFERIKGISETAIDGAYNFRLKPLKSKWKDVAGYMPPYFAETQLKNFITFLLENKRTRAYIDDCRVYDNYYRRLKRCALLGGEDAKIIREVLLSDCGEVEIRGDIPPTDEKYLKEFYGDKIYFCAER